MRLLTAFVGLVSLASAQTGTGVLTGTVTDPDGVGVLAPVQARNVTTGVVYKTAAVAKGNYTLSKLPAGTYDITVPPIGFTFPRYELKGVVIQAAKTARADIRLAWGGNLGTPGDDFSLISRAKFSSATGPAPRLRNGQPDFSGVWIGNAPDVDAPEMLPWAEEITKQRRARGGAGNPSDFCLPGDNLLVSPFLYKVIQTPTVIAILWEGNVPGFTQIFLDGRPHPKNLDPSWMGHSVGRWEKDTLVVDTAGFNDRSWLRVFPHTEMLHVVQRYRRPGWGRSRRKSPSRIRARLPSPGRSATFGIWPRVRKSPSTSVTKTRRTSRT
ncbi:MAG: carboxypeptidase regulatory-like domain-containing protein [Acidobacteriia bacterium]|nr:carboxypeptidase regulatory-like domain-containing protein [Terriglobia bacterium]